MPIKSLDKKLMDFAAQGLLRQRHVISDKNLRSVNINNNEAIHFCSNDYLGLTTHPIIKKTYMAGIEKYGVGSGSSALISGFFEPHQRLEEKMAAFLNRDRTILFNSGYLANLSVMSVLANHHSVIIADKLCHASLLDGITLSRAKYYRYPHQGIMHCERLLEHVKKDYLHHNRLLVTESVFSMEGDITPVDKFALLAKEHATTFVVDDAHGIGILGKQGRGICEYYSLTQNDVPCLIAPFGKAFGSMGAIVAGSFSLIEALIQFAKPYRYTTALPPALALALLESLNVIINENWRREKLTSLIHFFIKAALMRNLPLASYDLTPIKSILIGDNHKVMRIQKALMQHGLFISSIRPPTVPQYTARIRISLTCLHEENDITQLLDLIALYYEKR